MQISEDKLQKEIERLKRLNKNRQFNTRAYYQRIYCIKALQDILDGKYKEDNV